MSLITKDIRTKILIFDILKHIEKTPFLRRDAEYQTAQICLFVYEKKID